MFQRLKLSLFLCDWCRCSNVTVPVKKKMICDCSRVTICRCSIVNVCRCSIVNTCRCSSVNVCRALSWRKAKGGFAGDGHFGRPNGTSQNSRGQSERRETATKATGRPSRSRRATTESKKRDLLTPPPAARPAARTRSRPRRAPRPRPSTCGAAASPSRRGARRAASRSRPATVVTLAA